jgi:hypothetical protein
MNLTYTDVVNSRFDAGLFREWYARAYGATLLFGGCGTRWAAARRFAKHLAVLVGSTPDAIVEQAKVDYLNSEFAS